MPVAQPVGDEALGDGEHPFGPLLPADDGCEFRAQQRSFPDRREDAPPGLAIRSGEGGLPA